MASTTRKGQDRHRPEEGGDASAATSTLERCPYLGKAPLLATAGLVRDGDGGKSDQTLDTRQRVAHKGAAEGRVNERDDCEGGLTRARPVEGVINEMQRRE